MTQHPRCALERESTPHFRRGRRLSAALGTCAAAGLIAAGLTFVAAPPAYAQTSSQPPLETIVTASPAVLQTFPLSLTLFGLSARLDWVSPIVNEPIVFTAGGTTLCTATTNDVGVASCDVLSNLTDDLAVLEAGGYTATFAGDDSFTPGFAPSSGHGGLIQ
jgi:hypothetical protein